MTYQDILKSLVQSTILTPEQIEHIKTLFDQMDKKQLATPSFIAKLLQDIYNLYGNRYLDGSDYPIYTTMHPTIVMRLRRQARNCVFNIINDLVALSPSVRMKAEEQYLYVLNNYKRQYCKHNGFETITLPGIERELFLFLAGLQEDESGNFSRRGTGLVKFGPEMRTLISQQPMKGKLLKLAKEILAPQKNDTEEQLQVKHEVLVDLISARVEIGPTEKIQRTVLTEIIINPERNYLARLPKNAKLVQQAQSLLKQQSQAEEIDIPTNILRALSKNYYDNHFNTLGAIFGREDRRMFWQKASTTTANTRYIEELKKLSRNVKTELAKKITERTKINRSSTVEQRREELKRKSDNAFTL